MSRESWKILAVYRRYIPRSSSRDSSISRGARKEMEWIYSRAGGGVREIGEDGGKEEEEAT